MPTYSSDNGIVVGVRMSCEALRGATVCLFGSGAACWQCPIAAAEISKKYDEKIGRLKVARALDCNAVVLRSYLICVFCMLVQCRA